MRRSVGMRFLLAIGFYLAVMWSVPQARAGVLDRCRLITSKLFFGSYENKNKKPVLESKVSVGPKEYWNEARGWFSQIKEKMQTESRDDVLDVLNQKEEALVNRFFIYGFENSLQHGVNANGVKTNSSERVMIDVKADLVDDGVIFSITNPQVKEFPRYLKQRFFANSRPVLPQEQRKGYKGLGFAHFAMIDNLNELPLGSHVEWKADGKQVTVELYVRTKPEAKGLDIPLE